MALSGLRDITLEQPPPTIARQTYVLEHDWGLVADAIRRELDRGGQSLLRLQPHRDHRPHRRQAPVPAGPLGAHRHRPRQDGPGAAGGDIRSQMADGTLDILVCAIIETGIDLPNVNTLIIEMRDL